jgi:uncharacterized protein YxjI
VWSYDGHSDRFYLGYAGSDIALEDKAGKKISMSSARMNEIANALEAREVNKTKAKAQKNITSLNLRGL